MRAQSGGVTNVAGHRVEALEEGRSRLTLTLDIRGLLVPVVALFLTNRYMVVEAQGVKRAAVRLRRDQAAPPISTQPAMVAEQSRRSCRAGYGYR